MLLKIIAFSVAAFLCAPFTVFAQPGADGGQGGETESAFVNNYPSGTPRVKAACSLPPIKYVIDRIGGEYVDSISLIPPGFDPHTFEPKSSQLAIFSQADIYFSLDTPMEKLWLGRLGSLDDGVQVVNLVAPLSDSDLLPPDKHEHEHGHSHADEAAPDENNQETGAPVYDGHDPHVWMSPSLLRQMADAVRGGLSDQMPEQEAYFEKNYRILAGQIENLDAEIRNMLRPLPTERRAFLVFHPSWAYFAAEYDLTQMAVEQDGKEPTPMSLAIIIQDARNRGINVIFVQKEFNPEVAATVAAHLPGGRVELLDPLGDNPLRAIRESALAVLGHSADGGVRNDMK
ncbi:MAG: zinc ABC transporter substrate-binding protein [Desulfovibrionaceae bacterium]|nr:zinc ABC transporter substrate-binding protein [Desulfovibrionaceae bacterium]